MAEEQKPKKLNPKHSMKMPREKSGECIRKDKTGCLEGLMTEAEISHNGDLNTLLHHQKTAREV